MRRELLALLCGTMACYGCTVPFVAHAPDRATVPTEGIHGGLVAPAVAQLLNASLAVPHEMMWEVTETDWVATANGTDTDSLLVIRGIRQCPADSTTAWAVYGGSCQDPHAPTIHSHPRGNCSPSRTDFKQQVKEAHRYDVVWCGVDGAVFYWLDRNPLVVERLMARLGAHGQ